MIKLFHVCFILLCLFVVDVSMADDEIKSKNKRAISFNDLNVNGELKIRLQKNFDRLEEEKYKPQNVFLTNKQSHWWPGDTEGRTILGLTLLSQATHRDAKHIDEIISLIPGKVNSMGYFGDVAEPRMADEQQLSSHGWVLRGLCEYYEWKRDVATLELIKNIIYNLAYPTIGLHAGNYPIDSDARSNDGSFIGERDSKLINNWILSTDIGCNFIFLDGLVHSYELLRENKLKLLIEEMIEQYLKIDFKKINAQTHATLTALRALCRYYELTDNEEILESVVRIFDLYKEDGMTSNYENYNWFGRPTHTEPCAIHDSYIVAMNLWRFTDKQIYLEDAHHIYYNAISATQRENGGFGCNTCSGSVNPFLGLKVYEAHWCCTMRGGEGLSRVAQFSYFTDENSIYLTNLIDADAKLRFNDKSISLKQTTAYPFNGKLAIEITNSELNTPVFLKVIAPSFTSDHEVLINGIRSQVSIENGFLIVNRLFAVGDIIEINFKMKSGFKNHRIAEEMSNYKLIHYGPLLLSTERDDSKEVILNEKDKIQVEIDNTFSMGDVKLIPIYNLMEKFKEKQILFLTKTD